MTEQMMNESIERQLSKSMNITPEQIRLLKDGGFQRVAIIQMANAHGIHGQDAADIADSIDRIKTPTHIGPAPKPPLTTKTASGNANDRKWWKYGGGAVALLAVVLIAVLATNCNGGGKNGATSVHTGLTTETPATNSDLAKRAEALEANVSKLDTKVDLQGQALDKKLDDDVAKLNAELGNKVNTTDFSDNMTTIADELDKKADKKALRHTNRRVSRLEQKLNAHIAADAQASDTTTAPAAAGKTVLIIHKVPVDQ